jgi:hypothetical protein
MRIRVSVNFNFLNVMVVSSYECISPLLVRYNRCLNFACPKIFLVTFHSLRSGQRAVVSDSYGWVQQTMKCHKVFWKYSSI